MAFKAQAKVIDIDLVLTDNTGKVWEIGPCKPVNAATQSEFQALAAKMGAQVRAAGLALGGGSEAEIKENLQKSVLDGGFDISKAGDIVKMMAETVDYWYGQGVEFWLEKFDMATISQVQQHITAEFTVVKKK